MKASALQNPAGSRGASAFTLIELLVVISIIAVLAGILLPTLGAVQDSAKKTSAKSTVSQIVTAIKSYQADYGVYPNPDNTNKDKTWTGDQNFKLFNILRSLETANPPINTRHIIYFEGKDVKNTKKPTDGFATSAQTTTINKKSFPVTVGSLLDPWGVGYMVRYDTAYTDAVGNPYAGDSDGTDEISSTDASAIRTGIIVWSYGKDGLPGKGGSVGSPPSFTAGDDVLSWQ